ncbi:MAG: hypothetical protein AB8B64_20400, partial [Granulosicoccus sp.]
MTVYSGKRLRAIKTIAASWRSRKQRRPAGNVAKHRTLIDMLEPRLLYSAEHPLGLSACLADFHEHHRDAEVAELTAITQDMVHVLERFSSDPHFRKDTLSSPESDDSRYAELAAYVSDSHAEMESGLTVSDVSFDDTTDADFMLNDGESVSTIIYVTTEADIVDAPDLSSYAAFQNNIGVDNSVSLREAIIVANTYDDPDVSIMISLPNGDYTLTLGVGSNDDEAGLIGDLDLDGTFVIQGSDEEGTVIRQTVLERRVFDLNSGDVTFSELTIKDGSTESGQNGGGIYIDANTTASFENVTFSNNDASTDNGGAIYAAGDAVLNSVIMSESDALRGAGIFTEQGTNVVIRNSAISHNAVANSGGSEGGAIYTQGTLVISNSVLDSNAANAGPSTTSGPIDSDTRGGAIFVSSTGDATIDYTVLSNNSARSDGGAIHNEGTLALNYSSLNFNLVGRLGGGLHNMGEATLIGVTVWGNSGVGPSGQDGSGGGIYGYIGSELILSDSVVANNTSNVNTGGVHLRGIAEISDSFIVNNNSGSAIVDDGAGGISVKIGGSSDKVLFTRTVVADNLADGSNSDIFAHNKNDVVSGGSNFIEEYATKKENDEFEKVSESQPADTLYSDPGIQAIILQDNRAEVVFSNEPEIISNGGDATAAITVDESQTTVTTVVVSDDAGDTHTFSLSGVDKAAFSINSISGDLTFSSVPDPDIKDTYIVDVTVTDNSASYLSDTQTLTITVVSANEAPVISSNDGGDAAAISVDENQTSVTTVTSDDVEESPRTYSVSGADATAFLIDETTGELTF